MQFKNWIISEIKTPQIDNNFISNSIVKLKELETKLRAAPDIIKKAEIIEKDQRHSRKIEDLWYFTPLKTKQFLKRSYDNKPYSGELEDLLSYAEIQGANVNRQIQFILDYKGTRKDDPVWKERFRQNFIDLFGKEYSDGSGGSYIDNVIDELRDSKDLIDDDYPYTYSQAIETLKQTKRIFIDLQKYISLVEKVESHFQAKLELYQRLAQKYYNGDARSGDIPPQTKEVEVLYHATPYIKEILTSGLKVGEKQSLGGNTENKISFTSSFQVAKEIARCFREVIAIGKGQMTPDQVILKAKSERVDLSTTDPYRSYYRQKELDRLGLPRKEGRYYTDKYFAFELYRYFLAFAHHRYDPLFFGVTAEDFEHLDPKNVGVIAAKVDMSKIGTYLSSMEEYRIPPEAVLSFKVIRT